MITEHGSSSPDAIANRILQEILQSSETDQTRSNAISYNVSSGTNVLQQIDSGNIEHKIISENDFDTKYAPSTKRFHHDGFSRHGKKRLRHLFKAVSNNRNICDKPFIPPNGALKGHIGHYHVGSKIQYRCDRGYVLHGSFWNKCVFANGSPSWYFQTPSCRRKYILKFIVVNTYPLYSYIYCLKLRYYMQLSHCS